MPIKAAEDDDFRNDEAAEDDIENAGAWAQGLAKGVFAHKKSSHSKRKLKSPKKLSRKKRKTDIDSSKAECDKYFLECLSSRSGIRVDERLSCHNDILRRQELEVERLQEQVFSGVFDNIVEFVSETCSRSQASTRDTIPTAVLLTGVNMPDHNKVFDQLISKLGSVSSHVSVIGSGTCSNLKSLVQTIVMELCEDENEEKSFIKKADASFSSLENWYQEKYKQDSCPPLVVILQDFEASAGPALTDLILLMKRYSSLPFVLIFGVATTITTVHRTLPHSATAKLTINTFGSPPATKLLDQVIENVIIDAIDNPFKLSHKVFQFLIENFLFHDFAVDHFLKGYKFIIGEHFYRTPATFLCTDLKTAQAKLNKLNDIELDSIRRLPSFKAMVEKSEGDEGVKLLVDKKECVKKVSKLLDEYHSNIQIFTVLVKSLYFLVCDLPRKPLGKCLRDVYEYAMKGNITGSQQYKEAWQFLKLVSRYDLQTKCKSALEELKKVGDSRLDDLVKTVEESLDKLDKLADEDLGGSCVSSPAVKSLSAVMSSVTASSEASPVVLPNSIPSLPSSALSTPLTSASNSPQSGKTAPKLDRFKLKEALLQSMKEKNKATPARPYDIIRNEMLNSFNSAFNDLLLPPSELPLNEIFLFSAPGAVRRHLVGAPRAALHTALTDPWEYLDNTDLKIQDLGEISPAFPDICIGYKLHLECQKLINLYDWLMCWNTISTGGQEDQEVPDQVQQAKFARVVQELQHLGFIRTSSRKTDHVARLTFGGS